MATGIRLHFGCCRVSFLLTVLPVLGDHRTYTHAYKAVTRNIEDLTFRECGFQGASPLQKYAAIAAAIFKTLAYTGAIAAITLAAINGMHTYAVYAGIGTGVALGLTWVSTFIKLNPVFNAEEHHEIFDLQKLDSHNQ